MLIFVVFEHLLTSNPFKLVNIDSYLGVSLKWWYPHFTPQNDDCLVGKPMGLLGKTHHFRKHPGKRDSGGRRNNPNLTGGLERTPRDFFAAFFRGSATPLL